jgi:hypothetical protein
MNRTIFRAIPLSNIADPFVPSAMYSQNVKILEDRINNSLVYQYPNGCQVGDILINKIHDIKQYLIFGRLPVFNVNFNNINEQDILYSFLLSRVNIIMSCTRNRDYEILVHSLSLSWFTPRKEDECNDGFCRLKIDLVIADSFQYLKEFPNADSGHGYLKLERTWFDSALFQHLNYIYDVPWVNSFFKNIYPTMTMDWTFSLKIIEDFNFGGDDKIIVQMDLDKYITEFQYVNIKNGFLNASVFGVACPVNLKDQSISDFQHSNNNLMISQKALAIFWPWQYSIYEMENSDIGNKLDFHIVKK